MSRALQRLIDASGGAMPDIQTHPYLCMPGSVCYLFHLSLVACYFTLYLKRPLLYFWNNCLKNHPISMIFDAGYIPEI